MIPDPWPTDSIESQQLLAGLKRSIDERSRRADEDLLSHFLFTSWPTVSARES